MFIHNAFLFFRRYLYSDTSTLKVLFLSSLVIICNRND